LKFHKENLFSKYKNKHYWWCSFVYFAKGLRTMLCLGVNPHQQ